MILKLKPRLDKAKSIPGTLQYHDIILIDEIILKLKKTSLISEYKIFPKRTAKKQKILSTLKKTLVQEILLI